MNKANEAMEDACEDTVVGYMGHLQDEVATTLPRQFAVLENIVSEVYSLLRLTAEIKKGRFRNLMAGVALDEPLASASLWLASSVGRLPE